jgi:glutamate-1-semialdehyde 2,1-aminomutase
MLGRGYLAAPKFNATFAHTAQIVERYLADAGEVFQVLADAIRKDDVHTRLRGPVKHSDFRRLA